MIDSGILRANDIRYMNDSTELRHTLDLLRDHVSDYQSLFKRLSLDIGTTPADQLKLPTDARMRAYRGKGKAPGEKVVYEASAAGALGKPDPDLEELMFQFARYLIISCSRPGCMPR